MTGTGGAAAYPGRLLAFVMHALRGLAGAPSQSRRIIARQRCMRNAGWLTIVGVVAVVVLMVTVDVPFIGAMPRRGDPALWPARILTDFGKSEYVLWTTGALLVIVALMVPLTAGTRRARLAALDGHLAFIFLSVAFANVVGEALKDQFGRGRPFVGGAANAFNFHPFSLHEPFASLPSAHSTTAFALAFAVAAVWPRTRCVVAVYALTIAATRLLLLAHHPSDVVAGAVVGIAVTMLVRYWFAVRGLGFALGDDGRVAPLSGPSGLAG